MVSTLLLAAHGSSQADAISSMVAGWAEEIRRRRPDVSVVATYYKERPFFSEILAQIHTPEVVVVPLLTSSGHYSQNVLPREMLRTVRRGGQTVYCAPPLGEHPQMIERLNVLVASALRQHRLDASRTAVALIGHGTQRHPNSGDSTLRYAAALRTMHPTAEVRAFFLDQPPVIESVYTQTHRPNLVVVPFFVGRSHHVIVDIPSRLGIPANGSCRCVVHGRRVVYTPTPFEHPGIVQMILDSAERMRTAA